MPAAKPIDPTIPLDYPQTMKVSSQYAATHFDDLLTAATNGEEVEIVVPDKPTLKLIVVDPPSAPATGRRVLGALRGQWRVPTDEEWATTDASRWQQPERPRAELFGSMAGNMEFAEDWDSPETNKQIQNLFEGSKASDMASRG